MQDVIDLLRRWAELEPERCWHETEDGLFVVPFGENYAVIVSDGSEEANFIGLGLPSLHRDATLCGAIEAAIVEREDWQLELKGDFEGWEIRIWVRSVTRPVSAPTKLEAMLSAYVQALEAIK